VQLDRDTSSGGFPKLALGEHKCRWLVATCPVYDGLYPRSVDSPAMPLITVSG